MKHGNPFGPFWDHYAVDFDSSVFHNLGYEVHIDMLRNVWKERWGEGGGGREVGWDQGWGGEVPGMGWEGGRVTGRGGEKREEG